jgi:ATP-binding cassette, subfamily F, member 3
MIKLIEVSIAFGSQAILDESSWMLGDRDRIGLVGENGSGKSTLLKIMAGLQEVDRGKLEFSRGLRIGYLPQEGIVHSGRTLEEEGSLALAPVLEIEAERRLVERELNAPGLTPERRDVLLHQQAELMERFTLEDGYGLKAKVRRVLAGLGFGEDEFTRPVETFSGGWQMRLALAKILLAQPDVLLLDEPTNHLDLEARNWLEEFLRVTPCSYLIVSHDRWFLDTTVDRIVEVERGRLTDYRGDYTHYTVEKEKRVELAQVAYDRQQEEIARLKAFINKYKADKKRTGQVHTRMKMIDRLVPVEAPLSHRPIRFKFPPPPRGPQDLARLTGITKIYGERTVLNEVDLVLSRGEKVAAVGHNGAGKTTLLAIVAGAKKEDAGARVISDNVYLAYFGQDAGGDLDPSLTVMQSIEDGAPFDMYPRLRSLLGAFLFSGEDVDKKVSVLSGGEKSRLALAKLLLKPANLLILDEPTNHLDLRAKEVLMTAFQDYAGTLVYVAHDRYFLEGLPDRVLEVAGGKAASYHGDYSDYLHAKEREALGIGPETQPHHSAPIEPAAPAADFAKDDRIKRREDEKERRKIRQKKVNRIKKVEEEIAAHEARHNCINDDMCDSRTASDYKKLIGLEIEKKELAGKIERLMEEWERLHAELERDPEPEEDNGKGRKKYLRVEAKKV